MPSPSDAAPFALRQLSLPMRLTLAVFLTAIGFGYLAGLVQLHFAHAKSGGVLPSAGDIKDVFHGATDKPMSKMEKVLEAPESAPFNSSGTMRPAFTSKSSGWAKLLKERPEAEVRAEREGERLALLDWLRAGAPKEEYENDKRPLPEALKAQPITPDFLGEEEGKKFILVKSLFDARCTRCHMPDGADKKAERCVMDTYETIAKYTTVKQAEGMSLEKRAMFTHAHFLSFALVFGITGIIFTLTSYPLWFRLLLGPLPLLAQLVEMACWWLAILDPVFAQVIMVTGGIVALGLVVQILATLFHLFGRTGRVVLALLIAAALAAGWQVKTLYVDPYLAAKAKLGE